MKRIVIAALCMAAGGVGAAGLSINHLPLPSGSNLQSCLQRGGAAMQQVGLRRLNDTAAATWAENTTSDQLYTIYCVMETGTMVIAGAGPTAESVSGTVSAIMRNLRSGTSSGK